MTEPPFWNEQRLKLYAGAAFFALAATMIFVILSAQGAQGVSGRLGGDYAAFHGAGLLIYDGRASELYDWAAQAEVQAPFFPAETGAFLKFPYPPFFALPFAALAPLGFQGSFAVFTGLLWLCLWGSAVVLTPTLRHYGRLRFPLFVSMVFFYPMFRSVLGGQNTALTLLLLAIIYRCFTDRKSWAAGLALGFLFFKPQFAVPLLGLFLLRGEWKILLGAAVSASVLYGAAAGLCGMDWPVEWLAQVENFRLTDQELNGSQAVGLVGFSQAVLGSTGTVASAVGGTAVALVILFLVVLWVKRSNPWVTVWSITVCGLVVLPPHLLFYDAGLLVLPLLLALDQSRGAPWPKVLWVAGFLGALASTIGINPLTLLAFVTAGLIWKNRRPLVV